MIHIQDIAPKFFHALPSFFIVQSDAVFNGDRILCTQHVKDSLMPLKIFLGRELLSPVFKKKKF